MHTWYTKYNYHLIAETPFYTMRGTDYLESFSLPSNNFLSFA